MKAETTTSNDRCLYIKSYTVIYLHLGHNFFTLACLLSAGHAPSIRDSREVVLVHGGPESLAVLQWGHNSRLATTSTSKVFHPRFNLFVPFCQSCRGLTHQVNVRM